jgi:hypothetical protein
VSIIEFYCASVKCQNTAKVAPSMTFYWCTVEFDNTYPIH